MKQTTKDKINEIARLMWNEYTGTVKHFPEKGYDFSTSEDDIKRIFWSMAVIAYVECFPKHRDLLKYKI